MTFLYLWLKTFFADESGNEQTGMLLNIVITVVVAGIILGLMQNFLPELWDRITEQIMNIFNIAP